MNSLRDFNTFFKNIITMGGSYSDPALPTTKHERVLGLPTLSYKKTVCLSFPKMSFCLFVKWLDKKYEVQYIGYCTYI